MSLSMAISLFIIAACLMTLSYMVGEIVGTNKTTKKIQRFLESYSYARSISQLGVGEPSIKSKPHLFVLKNDDLQRK